LVRFLRNTIVAKVAGGDSSLLQISSDERRRVARVAEWFGEEDLARHLQIMLRTHGELGYRQEQRFHLELGLLKMAHAQRLLPLEQLLSEAGVVSAPRPVSKPTIVADARKSESPAPARSGNVSPFAADSARKGGSKPELSADNNPSTGPRVVAAESRMASVVMGAAAPATPQPVPEVLAASENAPESPASEQDPLRQAVLDALTEGGHRMLASMLAAGEWQVVGNELVVKVASSETVIDMSLGADAKRLAIATASGVLGRAVKLKVVPGDPRSVGPTRVPANGGRGRAEQDPIVRRMKEKFGAEIRTIIDYREKR
jgi:DNA polymerase-3 subunit gamma/tau